MDDNLTLECFLSLLDRAEASIVNDNLFESSDEYDYSVKDNEKVVEAMEDDISSDGWITWFCEIEGHEFFVDVDEDFIRDSFNLYGLKSLIPRYE